MNVTARRPASPYARRLARERRLGLELITGTGPNGRIVAADVEAFAASRAAGAAAPALAGAAVSVFGVSLDLAPLNRLLADLAAAGNALTLDDMLVRAGGLALGALPDDSAPIVVALEAGERGDIAVENPQHGLISALHARLAEQPAAGDAESGQPALLPARLSVRCFRVAGIRAVAMPLRNGVPLRLIVSAADGDPAAECLLSFDAGRVAEEAAAQLLGRIRDDLEQPLRLLA